MKVLRGNPGLRKLNENEPSPPSGDLTKPAGLSERAGVVWDELEPVLVYMGTLTPADVRPFWTLCEMQATWELNCRLKGSDEFKPRVELELANGMRPYYEYFGMTPASRARISVKKKAEEPQSKWSGALK